MIKNSGMPEDLTFYATAILFSIESGLALIDPNL